MPSGMAPDQLARLGLGLVDHLGENAAHEGAALLRDHLLDPGGGDVVARDLGGDVEGNQRRMPDGPLDQPIDVRNGLAPADQLEAGDPDPLLEDVGGIRGAAGILRADLDGVGEAADPGHDLVARKHRARDEDVGRVDAEEIRVVENELVARMDAFAVGAIAMANVFDAGLGAGQVRQHARR